MISATDDAPFFLDDISSIESSSRRERKFSEERICEQETIIKSLTYAVQRLADTLESKEEELQTKERELQTQKAEFQTQKAEFQITQRVDVELETKVLDLMIENAELKNRVVDIQDTPISRQGRKNLQRTPETTDDFSSFQRELTTSQGHHDDKENGENMAEETRPTKLKKPFLARRSSGPSLSQLIPRKLPSVRAGGRSLLTNFDRKRMSWGKRSGLSFPRLKPRYIAESSPDDVSDLSSSLGSES
ncbi:hypothetical protein N9140_00880 [bacterium]|nr:hypothetical protein [bacterium]